MDDGSGRILDDLPLGVWVGRTPDAQVFYANRAFREILGMAAVEGSRVEDIPVTYRVFDRAGAPFPVEQLPFSQVLATGQSVMVEGMVIHRADGSRVSLRAFGRPLRDRDGQIGHVIVAFTDISREVLAESERDTLEARLKVAVDHAPIIVFSFDREGITTLSEGAGLKALGLRSGEMVGSSVLEVYRDHPTLPGIIRRSLAGEALYDTVQVGDAVYDFWLTPMRDNKGELAGVLGVAHDMTELRRLQAATIQNDRVMAMGTLAASVAHEINNPLTYVLHYLGAVEAGLDSHAQLLAQLGDTPGASAARGSLAKLRDDLAPAHQGVQRITTIIRDLRSLSRADDCPKFGIDVCAVLQSVLKLVRKEIEVRAHLALSLRDVPPVLASETRLAQVFLNLLINARECLPESETRPQEIAVSTRHAKDKVVIEVSDTGPGVPPAERERVFEAFVTRRSLGGEGAAAWACSSVATSFAG